MTMHRKLLALTILTIIISLTALFIYRSALMAFLFNNSDSSIPPGASTDTKQIETIATSLETPWGIGFLPDGDLLVTQRPGTLMRISSGARHSIEGVVETSEGGLLGIALHPDFDRNHFLYLYSTYRENSALLNRVERYIYEQDRLRLDRIIVDDIAGSSTHDGGMIAFGPDGKLYITTGDANDRPAAQDTSSLSGKILRVNDDGSVPADNPFNNTVYSYGHRNPQGLAWDDKGRLWSTEHGPSGTETGRDELNLIEKGANYGWPVITGDETRDGMRTPVIQSGDDETWAPGAIAYAEGSLYFTGLRGQTLYRAVISKDEQISVMLSRYFTGEYGRLRAAAVHDGNLFISTSNTDGRRAPREGDDRILRINTDMFQR